MGVAPFPKLIATAMLRPSDEVQHLDSARGALMYANIDPSQSCATQLYPFGISFQSIESMLFSLMYTPPSRGGGVDFENPE